MEERIKNVIERMKADNIKFIRLQFVDLHGIPKNVSIPCELENMEDLLTTAFQSGNATAILSGVIVYLIVFLQRKNTAATRDDSISSLKKEIDDLKNSKLLMQKDIDFLVHENSGIKEDIKEIKGTLQQIAVSIAEIAVQYKEFKENNKKR